MSLFEIKNLSYKADGQAILSGVNQRIEKGEFVTISGPSGSGKSTFLKLLAHLISPSQGHIFYQGEDVRKKPIEAYRKEVSYAFQSPSLFSKTVRDNFAFSFEIRKRPFDQKLVVRRLEEVNLSASFLEQEISKISGGEKQRVALSRNLLFNPPVLLLDEVTTGLDPKNKTIIHELIENRRKQGATIVQVTHDSEELAQAKRIIKFDQIKKRGIHE